MLYKRSLRLTESALPWFVPASEPQADSPFAELKARLEGQTPERAEEASHAMFSTFFRLLSTLIGETLTTRLLARGSRDHGG